MPDILVRNVSPGAIEVLKKRAKDNGTSLQHEAKAVLERSVKYTWAEFAEVAREMRAQSKYDPTPAGEYARQEWEAHIERIMRNMRGES